MPRFELTGPDNKQYWTEGPEGSTREDALRMAPQLLAEGKLHPVESPGVLGTALDIGKGVVTGAAQAAEAFPGAAASLLGAAGRGVESLGFGDPQEAAKREQFRQENPLPTLTAGLPHAETTPGKYAESIAGFVPAAAASPGGWVSRLVSAFGGGAGAQAAADLVADPGAEPYARIIGGFIGGAAPGVAARVVNPLPATARHRAYVQQLEREGVTGLTAGERTGNQALRYAEEHLGRSPFAGQAAQERFDLPREQYTRAALARIGEDADRATPEVVDRAHRRIGNQFDRLAARNDARIDQQYVNDVFQAQQDYDHLFVDPLRKPMVENVVEHSLNKLLRSRTMTGAEYKAERSRVERMRRGNAKDPELNQFLAQVRDAMDNLMERNIRANNPADLGAWREVRNQYRNLLVIDRATTGAETGGIINPAKVKQAAVGQSRSSYARGIGDFGQLGRAGENVMGALPQSGTAPRALTQAGLLKLLSTGLTGRALMSAPVQAWLGNQELTDILRRLPTARGAAARSLVAEGTKGDNKRPLQITVTPQDIVDQSNAR